MRTEGWLLRTIAGAVFAAISFSSAIATEIPNRAVFAHYMVCCPRGGLDSSVQDFDSEIVAAEKAGIDGFVLNAGQYARYPSNLRVVERMYEAAKAHQKFSLMFSFDQSSSSETIHMISRFASLPNTATKDGKVAVSGWAQTEEWAQQIKTELAAVGIQIFLVPQMRYSSLSGMRRITNRGADADAAMASLKEPLDGYFYFGAGARAAEVKKAIGTIAAVVHSEHKLFMCGISPFYRGLHSNSRVFESNGFASMRDSWIEAIRSGADWIQLVTWNDWSEATYLEPFNRPIEDIWQIPSWQKLPNHGSFLRASSYYIDWFKTGHRPKIKSEALFYFYQLHPKNAEGIVDYKTRQLGRPQFWTEMTDRFHLAAFLKRPLSVTIKIGERPYQLELPAGDSVASVPLGIGSVSITLSSDGIDTTNELPVPIRRDADIGNFNYLSGEIRIPRTFEK